MKLQKTISDGNTILFTHLHLACFMNDIILATYLLDNRVYIDATDEDGETALHIATKQGNIECIKLLVAKGSNVNIKDRFGNIPLNIACKNGYLDIAKFLIQNGSDVNTINIQGNTIIHSACYSGLLEIVECTIENIKDINIKDNSNNTPLCLAFRLGRLNIVKFLINKLHFNSIKRLFIRNLNPAIQIRDKYDFLETLLIIIQRIHELNKIKTIVDEYYKNMNSRLYGYISLLLEQFTEELNKKHKTDKCINMLFLISKISTIKVQICMTNKFKLKDIYIYNLNLKFKCLIFYIKTYHNRITVQYIDNCFNINIDVN